MKVYYKCNTENHIVQTKKYIETHKDEYEMELGELLPYLEAAREKLNSLTKA